MKNERIAIPGDPADPEDRNVSEEGLEVARRARTIRMTRTNLGLSQQEFASRFKVPVATLRNWEQARSMPPDFALAYIQVIADHPEMVSRSVA